MSIAANVVGISLNMLLDLAGLTKEKVRVIGQTSFEIEAEAKSTLQGELIIPEALMYIGTLNVMRWDDGIDDFEDTRFNVGDSNGHIVLETLVG